MPIPVALSFEGHCYVFAMRFVTSLYSRFFDANDYANFTLNAAIGYANVNINKYGDVVVCVERMCANFCEYL